MSILAVDPGGVHVGIATFRDGRCVEVAELSPTAFLDELAWRMRIDVVVCEEFRLRRSTALSLVGSTLPTVELIGAVRQCCRGAGVVLVMQPPTIKRPTAAQLRHRGITLLAARRRAGGHARDAELHGWRYIFDHEKECA